MKPPLAVDYRRLVENLEESHVLYVHGTDGVFTYISPSVRSILGYEPEVFCKHYTTFMTDHPLNREVVRRTDASLRGEKQPAYLVELFHANGTRRWLEVVETPILGAKERVVGVQGIATDVTERVRIEQSLKESEQKFARSFHNDMVLATITSIPEGVILEANDAWLNFFGYLRPNVIGKRVFDLPTFSDRTQFNRLTEKIMKGPVFKEELDLLTRTGGLKTVLFSAERVEIGGRPCIMAMATDITDRKATETTRREQEDRLHMAMEAGGMTSWEWDIPTGRIRYTDSAKLIARGEDISVYSAVADLVKMIHPDDRERLEQAIVRTAHYGAPYLCEYRVKMHDGDYHWILGKGKVVESEGGRPVRVLGISMDITERKQGENERVRLLQLEREARLEAEAAVHDRDEFISIASHELKTPLAALNIQVEGLRMLLERGKTDPVMLQKGVDIAERQVQRLIRLVRNLLDITRIRAGRFVLTRRPIRLDELIHSVLQRLQSALEKVNCRVQVINGAMVEGDWDGDLLEQVVENLLSNAMKYGAGQPIEVACTAADGAATLAIRDYGIGVPADKLERIFEPYERAGAGLHFAGLGMGLYITREIVVAHGGEIRAENMPNGGGSRFTVVLPMRLS